MVVQEGCCEGNIIHQDVVRRVRQVMPPDEDLYDLADLFKALADSTRARILWGLLQEEMCVCDIAALLSMSQSAISHQLRVLKQGKIVKYRREGKTIYYSLDDGHVKNLLKQGFAHVIHCGAGQGMPGIPGEEGPDVD